MSHSPVKIYVRSSPLGEVGIHWRNISKPEQPKEEPLVLKKRVIERSDGKQVTINSLINDTKPSLILARYDDKVLLELTGLDAAEARSRKMGRRISEIVLWFGDDSPETESQLRKLAACALLSFWSKESTFLTAIRSSIDFDGLNGFKVNSQQIEQLYAEADSHLDRLLSKVSPSVISNSEPVWSTQERIIEADSQLYDLVNQISQTSLPQTEQPVVVVTEFKKESDRQQIVYKGNIWVEKKRPATTPEAVPPPEPALPQETVPIPEAVPTPKSAAKIRLVILRIILPILIALAILLITQSPVLTPTHSPIPTLTSTPKPNPTLIPQPAKTPVSPKN